MKKLRISLLALALIFALSLLSGCGMRPLPQGMEEETAGEAGRAIVALLAAEDYQAVADAFRADIREELNITAQAIEEVMEVTAEAGPYVSTDQTLAVGGTSDSFDEPFAMVSVYCEHESKDVIYTLSFDTDLVLINLAVKQK